MGFRFWRRMKIAPGVTLNLSKSGGSLSFGPRGAKLTVGPRGVRGTVGLPGTGLFYTQQISSRSRSRGRALASSACSYQGRAITHEGRQVPAIQSGAPLTMGFFRRLVTPDDEEAFVDACREIALGDEQKALEHARKAKHLADGAFLAGFLALKSGLYEEAVEHFSKAAADEKSLGKYFSKYQISALLELKISEEVSAFIQPSLEGVLLGLVEAYQVLRRIEDALSCFEKLLKLNPHDLVIKTSLAELLTDEKADDPEALKLVVKAAEGVENESPLHTALLLYKARALRGLKLYEAALETLSAALRKTQGRSKELLLALRYERAVVYEETGQNRKARSEFEKIFAVAPDYEDVAKRLSLN